MALNLEDLIRSLERASESNTDQTINDHTVANGGCESGSQQRTCQIIAFPQNTAVGEKSAAGSQDTANDSSSSSRNTTRDSTTKTVLYQEGTVLVFDTEGRLCECTIPYDRRVVGIVAGLGSSEPGMQWTQFPGASGKLSIAMRGRAFCRVDSRYGNIREGDLLTTSKTSGHAMKAVPCRQALGTIVGKALTSWNQGKGIIPVSVIRNF